MAINFSDPKILMGGAAAVGLFVVMAMKKKQGAAGQVMSYDPALGPLSSMPLSSLPPDSAWNQMGGDLPIRITNLGDMRSGSQMTWMGNNVGSTVGTPVVPPASHHAPLIPPPPPSPPAHHGAWTQDLITPASPNDHGEIIDYWRGHDGSGNYWNYVNRGLPHDPGGWYQTTVVAH